MNKKLLKLFDKTIHEVKFITQEIYNEREDYNKKFSKLRNKHNKEMTKLIKELKQIGQDLNDIFIEVDEGGIMLSEKEQKLYDFIKELKEVTIPTIEKELGENYIGGLGKLIGKGLVKSYKKRGENNGAYGIKYVKYYSIVEKNKEK